MNKTIKDFKSTFNPLKHDITGTHNFATPLRKERTVGRRMGHQTDILGPRTSTQSFLQGGASGSTQKKVSRKMNEFASSTNPLIDGVTVAAPAAASAHTSKYTNKPSGFAAI